MRPGGRTIAAGASLCCLTATAYLPALRAGFIWDDDTFLTRNPLIRAADGLRRIWLTAQAADYWPVTSSSLWLEWRLWATHAAGYHATNLLLHLACALLLWAVLARLRIPGAWFAALLFAVHPVNVESVAWITQRKNLLGMGFFLLSIYWFAGWLFGASGGWRKLTLSWLAFVAAMLSKTSVVVLPLVLVGLILWRRRLSKKDILVLTPFFMVAVILGAIELWFQRQSAGGPIRSLAPLDRLLEAGAVPWFYAGKLFFPFPLSFVYPAWRVDASQFRWWVPLLAALAGTAALWRWRRRPQCRAGLFAWGYFCLCLGPVLGITDSYFMKFSPVADHYQHLAMIGPIAFAAAAASGGSGRLWRTLAVLSVAFLGWLTWRQCDTYRDSETLFTATLEHNPSSALAHVNLGVELLRRGRADDAAAHFQKALDLDPGNSPAHKGLGDLHSYAGRWAQAAAEFQAALRIEPDDPEARCNLGIAFSNLGRLDDAIAAYAETVRRAPAYADAHNDLGIALAQTGRLPEAAEQFRTAVALDESAGTGVKEERDLEGVRRNLATVLRQMKSAGSP